MTEPWTPAAWGRCSHAVSERRSLLAALTAAPAVVFATLFGSRATGGARPDSDWDVGIFGRVLRHLRNRNLVHR